MNVYRNILHENIEANNETRQYFQDYINLLLDDAKFPVEDVLSEAKRMNSVFGKDVFTLTVLAKLYLEQILGIDKLSSSILGSSLS